ncbi:alpha/beta hydrolase [Actinorhabdospora filicis]|uniref:alpha/beta hydrolase n=1 Tax=Actinorhabdospora filicis TaxID=1785913 RepID=UPI002556BF5D|nr:alpha/beta hydrolase [Actinorhabdospora filicis]
MTGQVAPVLDEIGPHTTPLLIGSSLGSRAAALAAERGLPAVWITPTLTTDDWVPDALAKATKPFLLVGGTADPFWDARLARELSPHVIEVDGADHAMMLPGPLKASADVLAQVVTCVEAFLDEVVWP